MLGLHACCAGSAQIVHQVAWTCSSAWILHDSTRVWCAGNTDLATGVAGDMRFKDMRLTHVHALRGLIRAAKGVGCCCFCCCYITQEAPVVEVSANVDDWCG